MRLSRSLALFLPAALAAFPAAAQPLKVHVTVAPTASKGPCPAVFTFTGRVALQKQGSFTYKWERSDGAIDTNVHPPVAYDGIHPATVSETWTLGAAGNPLFHPFNGWVKLHVLTPADKLSNAANFMLDCDGPVGYPGPAKCNGKPDLVAKLHSPMDGWMAVRNNGTGNAGPSQLMLKCARVGYPGPGGGCPVTSVSAPFFWGPGGNASLVIGVNVPAVPCGGEVAFPMPFWANLYFGKGTYNFTATADFTNAVAESNEGNNVATSTLVKP